MNTKKTALLILISAITGVLFAQNNYSYLPVNPKPGDQIQITYRLNSKVFSDKDVLECTVYKWGDYADQEGMLVGQEYKKQTVILKKNGTSYQAVVPTDSKTRALTFNFTSGNLKVASLGDKRVLKEGKFDTNDSLGYVIPFYDQQGGVLPKSNLFIGQYFLWTIRAATAFSNPKLARAYFLKEIDSFPSKLDESTVTCLAYTYSDNERNEYETLAKKLLSSVLEKDSLTRYDYSVASNLAYGLKIKGLIKYFKKESAEKFKEKSNEDDYIALTEECDKQTDVAKSYEMLQTLKTKFEQLPVESKQKFVYSGGTPLGISLEIPVRALTSGGINLFNTYAAKLNFGKEKMLFMNYFVNYYFTVLNDSVKDYSFVEKQGMEYLDYFKQQYDNISSGKAKSYGVWDDYLTKSDKLEIVKTDLILINKHMATAFSKQNQNAKALEYINKARELAGTLNEEFWGVQEINDQYLEISEKQLSPEKLKPEVEKMISSGKWTQSTVDVLKRIYTKEKGLEAGFDTYLAGLKKSQMDAFKQSLQATQLNDPAPAFTLTDLDGKTVNLSDFRGKTVILDFWATWCGPCKASFPGMKKLQEAYRTNPNVVLLFMDTMERFKTEEENITAVKDFLTKNSYPFHVLLDSKSKVSGDYKVTGIPTKIIIDKNGNIRYKIVGAETNEGKLLDEVNAMLESVK